MPSDPLLLASGSPRRRELLEELGIPFEVRVPSVIELDSATAPHCHPEQLALENARMKAAAVAGSQAGRWVLGADTVVALEDRVFGKPESPGQAGEFLRALSGRTHRVITGCALISPTGEEDLFHETSRVTFFALTDETITRYLAQVDVLDKAGAYALQEHGEWIVASVEGSRANVVGLPVETLGRLLKSRGLPAEHVPGAKA